MMFRFYPGYEDYQGIEKTGRLVPLYEHSDMAHKGLSMQRKEEELSLRLGREVTPMKTVYFGVQEEDALVGVGLPHTERVSTSKLEKAVGESIEDTPAENTPLYQGRGRCGPWYRKDGPVRDFVIHKDVPGHSEHTMLGLKSVSLVVPHQAFISRLVDTDGRSYTEADIRQ